MVIDIDAAIEELRAETHRDPSFSTSGVAPEFDLMLEALRTLRTEIQLDRPNVDAMTSLFKEAWAHHEAIIRRVIEEMSSGRPSTVFGNPGNMAKIKALFDALAAEIVQIAHRRTEEFNRLAAAAAGTVDTRPGPNEDTTMTDLTRQEVDAKLAASEAKVDARLANFDTSIKTGFAELRAEMADMRAEAHKGTADIIKWGILTALGFATATVSILTFVINNVVPKQAAQPTTQPAPIVITVPSAASPTPIQVPAPRK
jgi:uncharacterized protein YdhG (YjbR/CyaY superfamily)